MRKELDLWQFVAARLKIGERMMLLVVAESHGSSPGRAGYKMAVAANGELCGSIGGGVMEVELVERAKASVAETGAVATGFLVEQVHRKDVPNSSGMICSGRQTVIVTQLDGEDIDSVIAMIECLEQRKPTAFKISNLKFQVVESSKDSLPINFSKTSETEFVYQETLKIVPELMIVGGGHCALALSEVMSRLGFHISIFDDRPELNTLAKNQYADEITVIDSYEKTAAHIPTGDDVYVVVMTLGYATDAVVIRQLIDHKFKYFGVLGSKAKMATLMNELRESGLDGENLDRIRTPVGLQINSRTPEEIAVSIAAQIISVKNEKGV